MLNFTKFFVLLSLWLCIWATSGTTIWSFMPMLFSASFALLFLICSLKESDSTDFNYSLATKNPFFFCGLILIILNIVQVLNPDTRIFQYQFEQYILRLDYIKALPSGIVRDLYFSDTTFSLLRLLATWYFAISSWILLNDKKFINTVLAFFVVNITLMSAFAIIQKYQGAQMLYWLIPTSASFYGSFFLENAAADLMNSGVFCAICLMYLMQKNHKLCCFYFVCALINFSAVFISSSKGAKVVLLLGLFIILLVFIIKNIKNFKLLSILAASAILLASFTTFYLASKNYSFEINESLKSRINISKISNKIFEDNLLLGSGGGTYGVRALQYSPDSQIYKKDGEKTFINAAHNDFYEYACEFGIIGAIAILSCFFIWIRKLYLKKKELNFANFILIVALMMTSAHSLFDLHLHITATMFVFVLLMSLSTFSFKTDL